MEEVIKTFAQQLNEAMQEQHMTQYRLSQLTGIPQATLSRYLSGKREIGIYYLVLICRTLNVSADYLLGLTEY